MAMNIETETVSVITIAITTKRKAAEGGAQRTACTPSTQTGRVVARPRTPLVLLPTPLKNKLLLHQQKQQQLRQWKRPLV